MRRNAKLLADFLPGEAFQAKNDDLSRRSLAGGHHFVQKDGRFHADLGLATSLRFAARLKRHLEAVLLTPRLIDPANKDAEQISWDVADFRNARKPLLFDRNRDGSGCFFQIIDGRGRITEQSLGVR